MSRRNTFNTLALFPDGSGREARASTRVGQFGSLLSYFGSHDLGKLFGVCAISAIVALVVWFAAGVPYAPPGAIIVTDFLISFLFLCALRLSFRLLREGYFAPGGELAAQKRIAIIGAGDVGAALARDLQMRRGLGMTPIAFFDDNKSKWDITIHGVAVQAPRKRCPIIATQSMKSSLRCQAPLGVV